MLSIEELRPLAAKMTVERFRQQLGPFALIQQPPPEDAERLGMTAALRATQLVKADAISREALSLLFQFERLQIATLPPLKGDETFRVGRSPDCEIVIDAASVSKHHAELRWKESDASCEIQDMGSTNGTFVNGGGVAQRAVRLADGDIVSFGEAQFWFLLAGTLHERVLAREPEHLRGRSG